MMFTELKYKLYSFPLEKKIQTSKKTFLSKDVIIIKAIDNSGNIFFSEVSPLPGFSFDDLTECKNELDNLIADKHTFPIKVGDLENHIKRLDKLPALKFGLEQLLLNLKVNTENQFAGKIKQNLINVNALVSANNLEKTLKEIDNLISKGFNTIKLKCGIKKFSEEIKIIEEIFTKHQNNIKLRLDINGKWNYPEAKANIKALSRFNIEYIEQPVAEKNDLLNLAETSEINLVPDESIKNYNDAIEFINSEKFQFLVLKPSIKIGIFDTIKIIETANAKDIKVIITSAFETAIGRTALIYLASLANHNFAHGLGIELIGENIVRSTLKVNNPQIKLDLDMLKYQYELKI